MATSDFKTGGLRQWNVTDICFVGVLVYDLGGDGCTNDYFVEGENREEGERHGAPTPVAFVFFNLFFIQIFL